VWLAFASITISIGPEEPRVARGQEVAAVEEWVSDGEYGAHDFLLLSIRVALPE
jgi:hypothetical protein